MEIRVLRYFLTVVHEESITKAAERLHITQPTLSRQLAALEEETGVLLFHRGNKKIQLTNEGFLLKRRAEEILSLVAKTEAELATNDGQLEGRIVIGAGELAAMQHITDVMADFQKKHPRVQFDLHTSTTVVIKDLLDKGLIDIGLFLGQMDMEEYGHLLLDIPERWVILMHPEDPLTAKSAITREDLRGRSLCLPSRMSAQNDLAVWFGNEYSSINVACQTNLISNAAHFVRNRHLLAITLEGAIPLWDRNLIAYRPLAPALETNTALVWKRNQPFGRAAQAFIKELSCLKGMKMS